MAPQNASPRRAAALLSGILLAASGLALLQGTTAAFAAEDTHVMPKGQTMKGPGHLKKEGSVMPAGAHTMSKGSMMGDKSRGVKSPGVGSTQLSGPLQVTLIGAPTTGTSRFEVRVSRDGQPVTDAKVSLNLSMPYHKHGATFSRLALSNTSMASVYGQYVGTVRTKMEGIYDARVSVTSDGDKSTTSYRFDANDKPALAHLGMWHPAGGFEVRLTTVPAKPKSGANTLRVEVRREGYAVTDATVNVRLVMPAMSRMGESEAYAKLTLQNGVYEGSTDLPHVGDWSAYITVESGNAKGGANYSFTVSK